MTFGANLKKARTEKGYTQEQFAELMSVSRQAVSLWESDNGYPEVEKLLEIGKILAVSLDWLFYGTNSSTSKSTDGKISIYSPFESVIIRCSKIMPSQRYKTKGNQPQYSLWAIDNSGTLLSGGEKTIIGWYKNKEDLSMEVSEINKALMEKQDSYTIKYAINVNQKGLVIEIV